MKVSIIGSRGYPYTYSGYETFVKEISERLVISGVGVRVYCHSSLFTKKERIVNGIELVYTPSINSKFFSQLYNSFFSVIHACFSDSDIIIFVNVANGPFGLITKFFKKKTIINVDGVEWKRPKWKGIGSLYFKFASFLATKLYDIVVTDAIEMQKIYLKKFKRESNVISYGHNKNFKNETSVLKKYSLIKNDFYLVIGRMIPDNNADIILKQFLLSSSMKKLVIVGDVPYSDIYSNKLKSIKNFNVVFTGYIYCQNELADLYKNCFAYVHGHEFGGTNPTMINAIYYNSTIFALNTVFSKEMLVGIENKYYFNKNDNSLKKLFKKQTVSINKKNKINRKYKWSFVVCQYQKLFKILME